MSAETEFKPLDPFDLYELYKNELYFHNSKSLRVKLGFPPSMLKRFLDSKANGVPAHKDNLDDFKLRVSNVGLFVDNLAYWRNPPSDPEDPEEDRIVEAYRRFHSRLGEYTLALEEMGEDDNCRKLKTVVGNVACSVVPEQWKRYSDHFDIPQFGVSECIGTTRYLQQLVNNSLY